MGSRNNGYDADRSSHVPIDESFMIVVAGQIKAPTKKAEQVTDFQHCWQFSADGSWLVASKA